MDSKFIPQHKRMDMRMPLMSPPPASNPDPTVKEGYNYSDHVSGVNSSSGDRASVPKPGATSKGPGI